MSTPNQLSDTPRTDAAWAKTFQDDEDQCRAGNAATDMRDECATLERELETEKTNRNFFIEKGATLERELAALTIERDQLRAELAAERARRDDLVADINDACITLASAKDDCDDYALLNTGFKLTAVRDVLIQYIPNAAMKEGAK